MILASAKLSSVAGLRHGFSTRLGGAGPTASMDLAANALHREENLRRFVSFLGLEAGVRVIEVHQVHGTNIAVAPMEAGVEADAIVASEPLVAIGIRTADCAPILVACLDASGRPERVAAIHAGWRGAVAGIVDATIQRLASLGSAPTRMIAAIGPTIGLQAFEVGDEVVERARASLGGEAPPFIMGARGRPHLDLRELVVRHLERAGLSRARIEAVGGCTFTDGSLYFSHRREGEKSGRHLSSIAFRALP